jgi:AhpD family alkylhydroperoxidase
MPYGFNRRIYTAGSFVRDVGYLTLNAPKVFGLMKDENISRSFMEKIMTVVTAVNGCPYCAWFHARQALSSGIGEDEIKDLLALQFEADADDFELVGLLYAQNYAETNRHPDREMTDRMYEYYGEITARHIFLAIRLIFFGNLSGNTFDAFLSRLKGNKAENSNPLFEFLFFIFGAPFLLPLLPAVRGYRQHQG